MEEKTNRPVAGEMTLMGANMCVLHGKSNEE